MLKINLFCLTRTYILNRWVQGMTHCDGVDILRDTHCPFCELYTPGESESDSDVGEIEDPVTLETECAEW